MTDVDRLSVAVSACMNTGPGWSRLEQFQAMLKVPGQKLNNAGSLGPIPTDK